MREILFRGKRVDNGEWVYGCLLQHPELEATTIHCKQEALYQYDGVYLGTIVIPETVGQFTGLTDKKGEKIFDGDKIKFKYHLEDFETANVFWSPDYLGFFTNSNGANHPLYYLSEIEIIGNIHDNPEDKA